MYLWHLEKISIQLLFLLNNTRTTNSFFTELDFNTTSVFIKRGIGSILNLRNNYFNTTSVFIKQLYGRIIEREIDNFNTTSVFIKQKKTW